MCQKEISNSLSAFLLVGEFFKYLSSKENLIRYTENNIYIIPSLIHIPIGSSYGEVHEFYIGNFKKSVSKTIWDAANNCKHSPRKYEIKWDKYPSRFYVRTVPLLTNQGEENNNV